MKRFTQLFVELDSTTKTNLKLEALERYFREVPAQDAAWALHFLAGGRLMRAVNSTQLRTWAAEQAQLPSWLVLECEDAAGDLAEAVALLLPEPRERRKLGGLEQTVEERLLPLRHLDESERRALLVDTWGALDRDERLIWNKLITGSFRVGVQRTLVLKALARVAGLSPETIAHRFMGGYGPSRDRFERLIAPEDGAHDPGRPYPFFLAHALASLDELGGEPLERWQVERKWDGIRAQLVKRAGQTMLWSRGEETITERFPEIAALGAALPDGTVLDGEVLAWSDGRPLPFQDLQLRIGRLEPSAKLLARVPAAFMAYDLLELDGLDLRPRPLAERRARLEEVVARAAQPALLVSPLIAAHELDELERERRRARELGVEGLMLKHRDSPYGVGRARGPWWKWKVDPYTVDAVLIYAQAGHGRRASLFTDYTFGLWHEGQLVPFAKAYSGLSDEEIRQVDAHIRRTTLSKHGPVRVVQPELVFELAFESLQLSKRHKSGVAVRFPRIARWRHDKKPAEADSLERLKEMLARHVDAARGR